MDLWHDSNRIVKISYATQLHHNVVELDVWFNVYIKVALLIDSHHSVPVCCMMFSQFARHLLSQVSGTIAATS